MQNKLLIINNSCKTGLYEQMKGNGDGRVEEKGDAQLFGVRETLLVLSL